MTRPGRSEIKEVAIGRADYLFRQAWGDPVKPGALEWRARESSACSMQMHGAKRGLWKDHKSGAGGDILDFIAVQYLGLSAARDNFPNVLTETARLCGIDDRAPNLSDLPARRAAREAAEQAQENREAKAKAELVRALVAASKPLRGTPAASYLARRGIDELPPGMAYLPPVPGTSVLHPTAPALVAWATDDAGNIRGGQRILISPDGSPAPIDPRKPAFGSIAGFPCRIPAKVSGGALVVCEGPETAASVWMATGLETWAVFGAGQFETAPLPRDRRVILCPDRDAPDSPAATAFGKACLTQAARGVDLHIAAAPEDEGSKRDLNDTLARAGKSTVSNAVNAAVKFTARDGKGRFTGAGATPSDDPAKMPDFIDPKEARDGIRQAVQDWMKEAVLWRSNADNSPPPVLAIAATPGAGKSRIAREVLAEFDLGQLAGDVIYTAPTLALADEAAAHSAEIGGGNHVTRGRTARIPGMDRTMCARPREAEAAAKAGLRVRPTLCEREDKETGKPWVCPHHARCEYLRQWNALPPDPLVRFEAAQYLTLPGDGADRETGALVIDESAWRLFTRRLDIPLDAWTRPRTPQPTRGRAQEVEAMAGAADATQAASDVLSALQAEKSPVLSKYSAEDFTTFAAAERGPEMLAEKPDAPDAVLSQAIAAHAAFDADARKRAALWTVLIDCKERDLTATERVQLVRNVPAPGTGERRDVIRVSRWAEPPRDKPVLLLDADADLAILHRLFPGADLLRFDLKPNAEVVQLIDRTFSNGALKRPEVRAETVELVRAEVYRDRLDGERGVLAIATRQAVKAVFEDAGHNFDDMDPARVSALMLETKLHGARWLWFGPASLGRNDWRDFGTAVVIGREELPLDSLEDLGRALFGDEGEPLQFVGPDATGRRNMPEVPLPLVMENGTTWTVQARAHPDPSIRAVQKQTRELATRQAFERLRLVNAETRKRVVLASKVPIPGLPVSRLATWTEMKPTRFVAAKAETAQHGGVLRLSAAGLAADAPKTFPSAKAAQGWLDREGREAISYPRTANKGSISGAGVFNPVSVLLRLKGQRGRETPALVVVPGDPRELVEAQLGPVVAIKVHIEPDEDTRDKPTDRVVPAEVLTWAGAKRIANKAEQGRQWRRWREAARNRAPPIKGGPAPAMDPAPVPKPRPARKLVILPEAEQINSPLVAEFLQARAARNVAEVQAVVEAFTAWADLDENNPEAWA